MRSGHDGKGIAGKVRNTTGEQQGPQRAVRTAAGGVSHLVRLMAPGLRSGPCFQRAMTLIHSNKNASNLWWHKHGFYIMREQGHGFTESEDKAHVAHHLGRWQELGDPRFWTLMVSPENPEKVDFLKFTRDLMAAFQKDLGSKVEWVAAVNVKGKHPHVHIAWRGVDTDGKEYYIPRAYLPWGFRNHVDKLLTAQLGYRRTSGPSNSLNLGCYIHQGEDGERTLKGWDSERKGLWPESKPMGAHHKRG